jgi:hypothetical protein
MAEKNAGLKRGSSKLSKQTIAALGRLTRLRNKWILSP